MLEGLCFEDFTPEKTYYTMSRTITEADLSSFTTLCGFFEPLFFDQAYVEKETHYKKRIAPGALTFSMAEGLTILSGILQKTGMALLEVELKVLNPVFIGDTITVEIDVIDKKETKKPDRGIVTFYHRIRNQMGESVIEYRVKRMMRRKVR